MGDRLSIVVPCELRFRDPVGALIGTLCRGLERSGTAAAGTEHQVLSAFNEAFNNVADYAYEGAGEVQIVVEIGDDELLIELWDQGSGFELAGVQRPDLDEMPESGLGVFIMRSFMNEVEYIRGERGQHNVLRMRRSLSRPPEPAGELPPPQGTEDNA